VPKNKAANTMLKVEKDQALVEANSAATITSPAALPRWLKVAAAVDYSAIGRSVLYELLNAGKVKSHRVGSARLVDRESLDSFISSQPSGL